MHRFRRGTANRVWSIVVLSFGVTACAGIGNSATPTATSSASPSSGLDVRVVGSDFAVGSNRFTFNLSDNNRPMKTAKPVVYFFSLHGFNALPAGHSAATFRSVGAEIGQASGGYTGLYVTRTTFDRSGKWGAEIDLVAGGKKRSLQTIFNVTKRSTTPAVGEAAPRSHNPTLAQEAVSKLDSGHPPDDMHRVNIASAIAHHRPLVVLFASAAYCGNFQCGPEIGVVRELERRYRAAVDFVHIDVFRNARPPHLSAPAVQWRVPSQPWVFIVDRHGVIVAKFEGPAAASEIEAAIRRASR
jgi:hypothetical protein